MHDTPPHIAARVREMTMARSGAERMRMGAEMFETARQMVLASFPDDLSPADRRVRLFLRFYGNDFDDEKRRAIAEHLARTTASTSGTETR